jgi:hypothetical protein
MIVAYQSEAGLWSVCIPQVSLICWHVSRDSALLSLSAIEGVDAEAVLASPVSAQEWRAAAASSIAGELENLNESVAELNDKALQVAMSAKIETVMAIARELFEQQSTLIQLQTEANAMEQRRLEMIEREKQVAIERQKQAIVESQRAYWQSPSRRFELRGNEVWAWEKEKLGWKRERIFKLNEVPDYVRERLK